MIKKHYGIPALVVGLAMLGGTSAYAFGPGGFNMEAFSQFTSEEQSAIEEANSIREAAEAEAQAVLEDAGITQEEIHDAIHAFREEQRAELDAALEDGDYEAYLALVADSPMADKLTEDIFNTLVEIHELEEAGDEAAAMELRQELRDAGFMGMGGRGGFRGGPPPAAPAE